MNLLIVGIDPGTTLGYAVLDIDGNLLEVKSSKQINFSELISRVIKKGKVLVVGCDKKNVPNFVKNFAIKNGAKVISPNEDLLVIDKKKNTKNYDFDGDHEMDALASALFAFKEITPLLKKIKNFVKEHKKQRLYNEIVEVVILREKSMTYALAEIEESVGVEEKIIKKVEEEKVLNKNDFLVLYNKLRKQVKENNILKEHNDNLKSGIKNLKEKYKYLSKKIYHLKSVEQPKELLKFKEKRIQNFSREITIKEEEISKLQDEITKMFYFLSSVNTNYILKKLDNLGYREFERLNPLLNIQKGDILLIEDPNIVSDRTISFLKNKVGVILYNKNISKKIKELPFIFIDSKKLKIEENKYLAIVDKKELDNCKGKSALLGKIVEDYRKERL